MCINVLLKILSSYLCFSTSSAQSCRMLSIGVIHVSKMIYGFCLILLSTDKYGWSARYQYKLLIYMLLISLLVLLKFDPVTLPILNSNSHWKKYAYLKRIIIFKILTYLNLSWSILRFVNSTVHEKLSFVPSIALILSINCLTKSFIFLQL